jgi:hypothetical protein
MKRISFVLLLVSLLFILSAAPSIAEAQQAISASYDTDIDFPETLTFSLNAESSSDITQVILSYKVNKISTVTLISEVELEIEPSEELETSWEWDMRMSSLPPGAEVQYSWRIEDAAGHELETTWETVRFDDDRYIWKSLTEGKVSLFWYEGNQAFGGELLDAATEALEKLASDTEARLERAVEIYIYASSEELRSALIYAQEWTGGVSFSEYGILAIGLTQDIDWVKGTIAHELAHLVTYQMTYNPYSDIPTWLNEGLSMYIEGDLDPTFRSLLNNVISHDMLISVQTLSSNFPTDVQEARLSYAESYSLVEFLIDNYGSDKMLSLLDVFKQGSTYDNALKQVYGFDTLGLDNASRASLGLGPREVSPTPTPQPTPTPKTNFFGCKEASANAGHSSTTALGALGILLLPGIGEIIRLRARRGKR